MSRWDDIAMISFIACDIILENGSEFKLLYKYKLSVIGYEAKDILKRLFK